MTRSPSQVVDKRKAHPVDKRDLLSLMLEGTDPKTGQGMTKESIVDNVCLVLHLSERPIDIRALSV